MFSMGLKGDANTMVLSILDGMRILKSWKTTKSVVYGSVLDQTKE
jgi:hypothetical protein